MKEDNYDPLEGMREIIETLSHKSDLENMISIAMLACYFARKHTGSKMAARVELAEIVFDYTEQLERAFDEQAI